MRRRLLLAGVLLGIAAQASAQTYRTSPNGPVTLTSTASAPATLDVKGMGTASVSVLGTGTFELTFQVVTEDGQPQAINCIPPNSTTTASTATASGRWSCSVAGFPTLRVVPTGSWSSGSTQVVLSAAATGGGSGGSASITGDLTVGAQPANDPHFVKCSDGSTANPCLVTLSGTNNITNVSGTVSLPTGASTAANQSTEITALQLIDNPIGSSTGGSAGTSSSLSGGIYNSSSPTLTNGQQASLQLNSSGALLVSGAAGGTSATDNSAFTTGTTAATPVSGLYDSTPDSVTDGRVAAFSMTVKRALHSSLFTPLGDALSDDTLDALKVTNATAADATSYLTSRLTDGTNFISQDTQATHAATLGTITSVTGGVLMGNASAIAPTDVGSNGDAALVWLTRNGAVNVAAVDSSGNALPVSDGGAGASSANTTRTITATDSLDVTYLASLATYLQPSSSTIIRSNASSADDEDETQVKATAGVLLSISGYNTNTTTNAFVRCTNLTAANTTPGASTVFYSMMLPFGGGMVQSNFGPAGRTFSTALTCYVVTGIAFTDTADAAANEVVVNIDYR